MLPASTVISFTVLASSALIISGTPSPQKKSSDPDSSTTFWGSPAAGTGTLHMLAYPHGEGPRFTGMGNDLESVAGSGQEPYDRGSSMGKSSSGRENDLKNLANDEAGAVGGPKRNSVPMGASDRANFIGDDYETSASGTSKGRPRSGNDPNNMASSTGRLEGLMGSNYEANGMKSKNMSSNETGMGSSMGPRPGSPYGSGGMASSTGRTSPSTMASSVGSTMGSGANGSPNSMHRPTSASNDQMHSGLPHGANGSHYNSSRSAGSMPQSASSASPFPSSTSTLSAGRANRTSGNLGSLNTNPSAFSNGSSTSLNGTRARDAKNSSSPDLFRKSLGWVITMVSVLTVLAM